MESDESRIHSAAHLMVASLAGSLAHVTCKVRFVLSHCVLIPYFVVNTDLNLISVIRNHSVVQYQVS